MSILDEMRIGDRVRCWCGIFGVWTGDGMTAHEHRKSDRQLLEEIHTAVMKSNRHE
jgi:hypothetical protein